MEQKMLYIDTSYTIQCTYFDSRGNSIDRGFPIDSPNPKLTHEKYLDIILGGGNDYLLAMGYIEGEELYQAEDGSFVSKQIYFEELCVTGEALHSRLCIA